MKLGGGLARRSVPVVLVLMVTAVTVGVGSSPSGAAPGKGAGRPGRLGPADLRQLATAKAGGQTTAVLLVAAAPGAAASVQAGLEGLGATVDKREDDISYLRVTVPIDQVEQASALAGIEAAGLDEIIPIEDPRPDGVVNPTPQPPPGPSTPRANAYLPVEETGAASFTAANPTWDGRGVTVGVLDTGITLDHPALRTTTTGSPKIVDWVTSTDPFDDQDPTWVPMATQVRGATFVAGGTTWTSPYNDRFRFGLFNERDPRLGGEVGSDVNRDGNPAGSSGLFGVLWDGGSLVWVDRDQDRSFADEAAMTDYKVRRDVAEFGVDNPATPTKEAMPFVVQVDRRNRVVNIGIVSGAHGTHVGGIVAANGLFGGAMGGAAPGAQLVSVRVCLFISGCTATALIEGMIYAARTADVDVINMSIGGLPSLNDANNARAVLYNRLIDRYDVQMYISAGNSGPGENTVGDPSVATDVVSVGTYISDATWNLDYGSSSPMADNQHPFSSRGPREDGGFKPDLIAPGAAVSSTPLWQPGGPVAGTYALPPGYSMFNGTSMAAPQTAGAGALLVGAAKQAGVAWDPARLRTALKSTARFLPHYGAYEQGNGLIDVPAAWSMLATGAITPRAITSAVPVSTALSMFLATPNVGVGIHDREGVVRGRPYTRTYTFTRTNGPARPVLYHLSMVGNDGTFELPVNAVALSRDTPVSLTVGVNPSAYGIHSAILNLDDEGNPGIEYQTLNTVLVPFEFDAANGYSLSLDGSVGRNQFQSYLFRVPAGTPAFKVDLAGPSSAPGTGQARFIRSHPFGVPIDANPSTNCYIPVVAGCSTGNPASRTELRPTPGVWEVTVEARRTSDALFTPYRLTASVLGALVAPDPDVIPSATVGVPVARTYAITNLFGAFTGRAQGTALGSALLARPSIADQAQQVRTVAVTPGSVSLRATLGNPSDPAADLDLFVYDCTTGTCRLVGASADGDSEESVTVANPAPGQWAVVVEGFAVPAGTTAYDYVDVVTNPAFGAVAVTDANALRPAGATWTVPGTVTALAAPTAGRVLLGAVEVRTDANVLVGSGRVVVEAVVAA